MSEWGASHIFAFFDGVIGKSLESGVVHCSISYCHRLPKFLRRRVKMCLSRSGRCGCSVGKWKNILRLIWACKVNKIGARCFGSTVGCRFLSEGRASMYTSI